MTEKKVSGSFDDQMGEILNYFRLEHRKIPDRVIGFEERLECLFRPHGIMFRDITLSPGWYKDAFGPMAGRLRGGGVVALIPSGFSGYSYRDPDTDKRIRITSKNAAKIDGKAYCFYRSLPPKKLTVYDLLHYICGTVSAQDFLMLAAGALLVTLTGMILPVLVRILAGEALIYGSLGLIISLSVFYISAGISTEVLSALRELLRSRIEIKMNLETEAAVMMRVLSLPAGFFRDHSPGDTAERMQAVGDICSIISEFFLAAGLNAAVSLLYFIQIPVFAPSLAVPAFSVIAVRMLLTVFTSVIRSGIEDERLKQEARESSIIYSVISGIRKIRIAGAERRAFSRWARIYNRVISLSYEPPVLLKMDAAVSRAVSLAGIIAIYYISARAGVSAADYFAFNTAYGALTVSFASMSSAALMLANVRPALNLAAPLLEAEPEASGSGEVFTGLQDSIEVKNISFRYGDRLPWIFQDLSLTVRKGEYVAIVGKTGCGKSTLVKLLLGFERPQHGAIYYDEKDIQGLELRSLRSRIGTVMQDGGVFPGTIYENIALAAPGLPVEKAWEAARIAGIADEIKEMPMRMNTLIPEGGGGISTGQRQRIMIARAVASEPGILIFDEAVSALDGETLSGISDALEALDCTRIVITHSLSAVRNCDRVIMLEGGA